MDVAGMVRLASGLSPSLGSLMGSNINPELLSRMNNEASSNAGGIVFGDTSDPYAHKYNNFMSNVIRPMEDVSLAVKEISEELVSIHTNFIPVVNTVGLLAPTNEMKEVILTHNYNYHLVNKKKIKTWDLPTPESLKLSKEVYDRVVNNGLISDLASDEPEHQYFIDTWYSSDPVFSNKEEDAIVQTRAFVDKFICDEETKDMDMTDYPNLIEEGKLK